MMLPPILCATMRRAAACAMNQTPIEVGVDDKFHSSRGHVESGTGQRDTGIFDEADHRAREPFRRMNAVSMLSAAVTSRTTWRARPPSARISPAIRVNSTSRRAANVTSAPARASMRANRSPSPPESARHQHMPSSEVEEVDPGHLATRELRPQCPGTATESVAPGHDRKRPASVPAPGSPRFRLGADILGALSGRRKPRQSRGAERRPFGGTGIERDRAVEHGGEQAHPERAARAAADGGGRR